MVAAKNTDPVVAEVSTAVRRDFTKFCQFIYPGYQYADHLGLINGALMQLMAYSLSKGHYGFPNLMIEAPPRHSKSVTVSQLFPAWFLGLLPSKRVILASYGSQLATKNSREVKNFVSHPRFKQAFNIGLAMDSKAKNRWDIGSYGGGLFSTGVGGAIAGFGADLLILDDVMKGRKDVESQLKRDTAYEWMGADAFTRREPGSICVIVGTRWHEDDPMGRLIMSPGFNFVRIKLPAIAETGDILGRKPGEALWPARYPIDKLLEIKNNGAMSDYDWSALFQQSPTGKDGGLFKRHHFPIINDPPSDIIRRVRFWDLALSGKNSADSTVGVLMGETSKHDFVILDVVRRQLEWDAVPGLIRGVTIADGTSVRVGIEEAFYQTRAVEALLRDSKLHNFAIKGYKPDGDKFTRALPFSARAGNNQVTVLNRSWTQAYIGEMLAFPMGAHDDQVDATSGAYFMMASYRPNGGIW